jgi:hypothetical protein
LAHAWRIRQARLWCPVRYVLFDLLYLGEHPDKARIFDAAMVGIHGRESSAVLDAYDFSRIGLVADIGGGNGSQITEILKKHDKMKGILFDLPHVIELGPRNPATQRSFRNWHGFVTSRGRSSTLLPLVSTAMPSPAIQSWLRTSNLHTATTPPAPLPWPAAVRAKMPRSSTTTSALASANRP